MILMQSRSLRLFLSTNCWRSPSPVASDIPLIQSVDSWVNYDLGAKGDGSTDDTKLSGMLKSTIQSISSGTLQSYGNNKT